MVIITYNAVIADFTVISFWFTANLAGFTVSVEVELGFLVYLCLLLIKLIRVKDFLLIVFK